MVNADSERHGKTRRKLIIALLLSASALLLAAAAVIYILQEDEGIKAGQRAEELLVAVETGGVQTGTAPVYNDADSGERQRVLNDLTDYDVMAKLSIPELGLELPVIAECSDEALTVSVCRFLGPLKIGEGHLVITGHNYRSGDHFGLLNTLDTGDRVELMDVWGDVFVYEITSMQKIRPDDMETLTAGTGEPGLSLLTCTANANRRLVLRCQQIS